MGPEERTPPKTAAGRPLVQGRPVPGARQRQIASYCGAALARVLVTLGVGRSMRTGACDSVVATLPARSEHSTRSQKLEGVPGGICHTYLPLFSRAPVNGTHGPSEDTA